MTDEQTTKRDWLNRAYFAEKKLSALLYKRERDKERAEHITTVYGSIDKGRSSSYENRFENDIIRLLGSDEEYNEYLQEYMNIREEIQTAINNIHEPVTEAILIQRHLNFMSIEQIAETLNYSDRSIKRKYLEGLEKLSPNVTQCH